MMSNKPFLRGEKSSVSVRVRNKKQEALNAGQNPCKKRNRHSGDFSFFNHKLTASPTEAKEKATANESADEKSSDGGGDWAYITFPNGVPTVQDIKTNGPVPNGITGQAHPVKVVTRDVPGVQLPLSLQGPPMTASQQPASLYGIPSGSPIQSQRFPPKVSTPTGNPTLDQINASFRQQQLMAAKGKRMSADLSQFTRALVPNGIRRDQSPFGTRPKGGQGIGGDGSIVVMRNKANRQPFHNGVRHSRIVEEQLTGVHLRNPQHPSPRGSPAPYVTKVNVFQPPQQQQRPNMLFRRKSEQPNSIALMSGAAKRCSGEFDFMKNGNRKSGDISKLIDGSISQPGTPSGGPGDLHSLQQQFSSMIYQEEGAPVRVQVRSTDSPSRQDNNTGSSASTPSRRGSDQKSPESPAVVLRQPRQTGLGRRAVTQIQIQQKKNSYVSAVCKSQENLAKVRI